MHVTDAKLRHRELTQEVYDIGDEVATYIDNLVEALTDWDTELVADCRLEFDEIVVEARDDSRRVVAELAGVRQALVSGLRSGSMSTARNIREPMVERPSRLRAVDLLQTYPLDGSPIAVRELADALNARSSAVVENLGAITEWVIDQTAVAAADLDSLSLPLLFSRTRDLVTSAVEAWTIAVAQAHPAYTRTMRGHNPPQFLMERARIDAVVARVARRRAEATRDGGYAS
ncbi:hypothetical protein [Corynebacterium freiburgense]|uniref:hypothetical protein n=1 Tax=Corynebacterium freiburgense TaxID=556548 RepID=UPI0004180956|nr:hypothetical protein [Corynebacterium freiburgense]WJZ03313.1 hypothetical protein CFREI_10195 [Corynebacterium freiburgense]